jgi:ribosomal protein S18 acetylase RimI-like enzyme
MLQIRPLSKRDYDSLIILWEKAGLPYKSKGRDSRKAIQRQIEENPDFLLGAFLENELIGCVIASFDGRKGWINRVAVSPDHRKTEIATYLIEAAEKALRKRGAEVIGVLIYKTNELSLRLFQKIGYSTAEDILYLSKRESKES